MLIRGRRRFGRHPGHLVGVVVSQTTGQAMAYESSIERAFLQLCDFDPSITKFQSQPFQMRYWLDGRERRYTPDVLIEPNRLIEVKPERRTQKPEFRRWARAVNEACTDQGYVFEVITDVDIRRQPRFDNVLLLRRYQWQQVPDDVQLDVNHWVRERPGIRLGELVERLGHSENALANVYGLMAQHAVRYDIHRPLDADLPIFPN